MSKTGSSELSGGVNHFHINLSELGKKLNFSDISLGIADSDLMKTHLLFDETEKLSKNLEP